MDTFYKLLIIISACWWLCLFVYGLPSAYRVVFADSFEEWFTELRPLDPLGALFTALAFTRLGYVVARLSFWDAGALSSKELTIHTIMTLFTILCTCLCFKVLCHYRGHEDLLR